MARNNSKTYQLRARYTKRSEITVDEYAFTIFKEGHTDWPIHILVDKTRPDWDKAKKIAFYKELGYDVFISVD